MSAVAEHLNEVNRIDALLSALEKRTTELFGKM